MWLVVGLVVGRHDVWLVVGLVVGRHDVWLVVGLVVGRHDVWLVVGLVAGGHAVWLVVGLVVGRHDAWLVVGLVAGGLSTRSAQRAGMVAGRHDVSLAVGLIAEDTSALTPLELSPSTFIAKRGATTRDGRMLRCTRDSSAPSAWRLRPVRDVAGWSAGPSRMGGGVAASRLATFFLQLCVSASR